MGAEASANVLTDDQRQGKFDPSTLTGAVDGGYWAQVLDQRMGNPVGTTFVDEPYSFAGCTSNTGANLRLSWWCDSAVSMGCSSREYPAVYSRSHARRLLK